MLDNFSTKHCDVTTLTSAWIETARFDYEKGAAYVALSRVRGLKRFLNVKQDAAKQSHSDLYQ